MVIGRWWVLIFKDYIQFNGIIIFLLPLFFFFFSFYKKVNHINELELNMAIYVRCGIIPS